MSIGANVSVVTAGAILAFAVRARTGVVSVHAVGAVLMAVGVVGLVLQLRALARQRRMTPVRFQQPAEAVLVRPAEPTRLLTGTTADPLPPEDSPYQSVEEYNGNEW